MRAAQRTHVVVNVGNVLELAGAGVGCYGVAVLAGVGWALVAAGVVLVVGAELVYDSHGLRVPLPRRPRPVLSATRCARRCWGGPVRAVRAVCRRRQARSPGRVAEVEVVRS